MRIRQISTKTKILFFALLFIILPSGILGYFGLKAIENRGLKLKENYQGIAKLMRDKVEGELRIREDRFRQTVSEMDWNGDSRTLQLLLRRIQDKNAFIREIFLLDADGSIVHPFTILPAEVAVPADPGGTPSAIQRLVKLGEQSEFQELDYQTASARYAEALKQAPSSGQRAYARMCLARCFLKAGNFRKAAEEYRLLAESDMRASGSDGTPLKIIGLSRLADTYASLGEEDSRLRALLTLYETLILFPEGFPSFDLYLVTVKKELENLSQNPVPDRTIPGLLEKLRSEEKIQIERAHSLLRFRQDFLARLDFDADPESGPLRPTVAPLYTAQDDQGKSRQIGTVNLPFFPGTDRRRALVYQIDEDYVLKDLLPEIEKMGELGKNVYLGLFDDEEAIAVPPAISSQAQALAAENFSRYFPWRKLLLFDKQGKTVERILRNEKLLYSGGLIGIFVLIFVGVAMTLKAATHEAEAARLKSEFVSNVSHELKTPLALIRLFGETLELDEMTDDGRRKEFSRIIARESQRLSHLIDNVLDFSKIDSGRKGYILEREDLVAVMARTLENYKTYLRDQGFTFDISLPPGPIELPLDKEAISQALLNLLSNAEKFSKERKYIGVKVFSKNSEAWIVVEDHGSGIAPSDLKRIFDRFYRGEHGPARDTEGCGLGLTIVKLIVESHGGRVEVESEVGRGSRFTIILPRK